SYIFSKLKDNYRVFKICCFLMIFVFFVLTLSEICISLNMNQLEIYSSIIIICVLLNYIVKKANEGKCSYDNLCDSIIEQKYLPKEIIIFVGTIDMIFVIITHIYALLVLVCEYICFESILGIELPRLVVRMNLQVTYIVIGSLALFVVAIYVYVKGHY